MLMYNNASPIQVIWIKASRVNETDLAYTYSMRADPGVRIKLISAS